MLQIAKWLNLILREVLNFENSFAVKNTLDLTNKLKNIKIPKDCFLVSFDVNNLFPSIPPKDCLKILSNLLNQNCNLSLLHKNNLLSLTEFVLNQNFFCFNNKNFIQKLGLAMGSSLSPFLAELFMNNLEKDIFKNICFSPHIKFWYRYVDDVLCLFTGNSFDLNNFLTFINSLHTSIKFSYETEINNQISFLDLLISRNEFSSYLSFEIFRKSTCTDNVISYFSLHPYAHKMAVFHSLFNRLFKLPLSLNAFEKELGVILQIAFNNNFPNYLIEKLYFKYLTKFKFSFCTTYLDEKVKVWFPLKFAGQVSVSLSKLFSSNGINIAFSTVGSVFSRFVRNKDQISVLNNSGVYSFSCNDCNSVYIGQTGRSFLTRGKEHLKQFEKYKNTDIVTTNSSLANHLLVNKHTATLDNLNSLHLCTKSSKLNYLEILEIYKIINEQNFTILNDFCNFNCPILNSLFDLN